MNKSAFEMMWDTITSNAGLICAVKAWLWTAVIIMILCIPVVIKETIRSIAETIAYNEYLKERAKDDRQTDRHKG